MHNRTRTFLVAALAASIVGAGFASSAMAAGIAPIGIHDDRSTYIEYTGTWTNFDHAPSGSQHIKTASAANASAEIEFSGRSITWMGWTKTSAGIAKVYIDTFLVETVDLYSTSADINKEIYTYTGLTDGTHTLKIVATGTNGLANTGSSTTIYLDGFTVRDGGTYENDSTRTYYTGSSWSVYTTPSTSGGSFKASPHSTATVSLTFTGPSVSWYTYKASSGGDQQIWLDDSLKKTFNSVSSTNEYKELAYTAKNLSGGEHTITIKSPATGTIHHDSFVVGNATPVPPHTTAELLSDFTTLPTVGYTTVNVDTAAELHTALEQAASGQIIQLAPNLTYTGEFDLSRSGTVAKPIWIVGARSAVITTNKILTPGSMALSLAGADNVRLSGFTVKNSFQGVQVKDSHNVAVADLWIHHIGHEAVHFRVDTTDSFVVGNLIEDTGLYEERYSEGVYIGTSPENWGDDGKESPPDVSSRNMVAGNTLNRIPVEHIEAKAGTANGIIRDNVLNSHAGDGTVFLNSMLLVGGDNNDIVGNSLTNARKYGLAVGTTLTTAKEYGHHNSFRANSVNNFTAAATITDRNLAYRSYAGEDASLPIVLTSCDNTFTDNDLDSALANVWCTG